MQDVEGRGRGLPSVGSVDVLCIAYGGGHIAAMLPVARALQGVGIRVCLFALTTAIAPTARSGVAHFTYADLPEARSPRAQAHGARLAAEANGPGILPSAETEAYLGVNYADMESALGAAEAARRWAEGGRQVFFPKATMRAVLDRVRPRLVVATNSPRSERAMTEAASEAGIPAVTLVDLFALHAVEWIARPGFGTHLYVLDEGVKRHFVDHGRPAAEITVTGNPAFDTLHDPETRAAGLALRRARGWGRDGRPVVLYASSGEPKRHPFTGAPADPALPRRIETRLRAMLADGPWMDLVLRRHPSEDQEIAPGDGVHASPREDDVNVLLHAVDAVVVTCSTVGLQGHLVGKPVLAVEGSVFNADAPYAAFGMATRVPALDDLEPILRGVLAEGNGPARRPVPAGGATGAILLDLTRRLDASGGGRRDVG